MIESYSAAAAPASKEKRIRAFSELSAALSARFPVLLFFGICRDGASLLLPRSSPTCGLSRPISDGKQSSVWSYSQTTQHELEYASKQLTIVMISPMNMEHN